MYASNRTCRAFDKRDPADKITDILLRKQLEQIEKAQKSFAKQMTAQQNIVKRRFDEKVMRTENGYAKLWESRNMTNIWLELNQDMNGSYSPTASTGNRRSGRKRSPKSLLIRGKTELGSSTGGGGGGGGNGGDDCAAPETAQTLAQSKNEQTLRSNKDGYKHKFQRNVTFVNSKTLLADLGDNPKVTQIRPGQNGLTVTGLNPAKTELYHPSHSSTRRQRKQNRHLQSHCWGSKFFSNQRTPRHELRRYSKIGSPTKNFLGGVDVSHCFTNNDVSLDNRNTDNYESQVKDFCDSLKKFNSYINDRKFS